jgi:hypothetical protein
MNHIFNCFVRYRVCLSGILAIGLSWQGPKFDTSHGNHAFLYPPKILKHLSLGYSDLVADSLWLRVIQDMDFCEGRVDYSARSVTCQKGWVFQMLDLITVITPRFRAPYIYGGTMLSVLVQDVKGASIILERGHEQFPADGAIALRAAYHAMEEEKNLPKAINLLIAAGKNGAPPWVFALASRLSQKTGQLEFARKVLIEAKSLPLTGYGKERIDVRLKEIEAALKK